MLCCTVLYCTVICCSELCCAVLCCAVLCCAMLCCAVLFCAVLCCAVLCCALVWCAVVCCAVLHSSILSLYNCGLLSYPITAYNTLTRLIRCPVITSQTRCSAPGCRGSYRVRASVTGTDIIIRCTTHHFHFLKLSHLLRCRSVRSK